MARCTPIMHNLKFGVAFEIMDLVKELGGNSYPTWLSNFIASKHSENGTDDS